MTGRIVAVLVVPQGTHRPEPLARALRTLHPQWEIGAVWCGDPQLRPKLHDVAWLEDDLDIAAAEVARVSGDVLAGEWTLAIGATAQLLQTGVDRVVLLWIGATAVLSSIDALVEADAHPMTLVPRAIEALPDDDLVPTEVDLAAAGLHSTSVACFGAAATDALAWLAANLTGAADVGRLLSRAAQLFGARECRDESIGVGRWRWGSADPALLDVAGYDPRAAWTLDPDAAGPQRVELLGHAARQMVMSRAESQLAGERTLLCLPGGVVVDPVIRRVVATADDPPPAPWSASGAFRTWLAPRYWRELHEQRRDLVVAFPDPEQRSAPGFRRWCREAFTFDDVPMLLAAPEVTTSHVVVADVLRDDGLNLVGYLTHQSGLGDVARRLRDAAGRAGLANSAIATYRTASPTNDTGLVGNRVEFTNSLCVVTADQFPFLAADMPELFAATRKMIGYWFWELEHVPLHMRRSISLVDEIWAGSRFVTDAFAAVSPVPVRHVPIPVAEPHASPRRRVDFAMLADIGDRPLFLTTFDHLSVTERKNPVGAIEAFCAAFDPDEGPLLIIKTMNGHQRWANHQRVLAAADGRGDIRVWDETLERSDQMALVASADCMVSLHRSEGLGLHLAEAMWLGTPTIATRYSGNLDFMNDDNSLLIDAELVPVEHGEGVYPPTSRWAAPDLDEAAAAMRRLASDGELGPWLAAAGRQSMEQQPTLAETGRLISQLLLGRE